MKAILLVLASAIVMTGAAFGQNYTIKQKTTMNGQSFSSTVYVKGSRKRTENSGMMGMGGDVADIEQCDLKRTVKVSDKKKKYYVEPAPSAADEAPARMPPVEAGAGPRASKGGTITINTSTIDTGERKQMFGLLARHIKTMMTMESSPDACSHQNTSIEGDGWYVDLPQFSCPISVPRNPYVQPGMSGCTDKTIVKSTGTGKLGFPLALTQTIRSGGEGGMEFTQTVETIEFSKAPLDDALFDVPAGYAKASSSNDLYGMPDYAGMMGNPQNNDDTVPMPGPAKPDPNAKRPGVIRIGVLTPDNKTTEPVSTNALQTFLATKLNSGNHEGVAVANEVEARARNCDYVVSTDITMMKQSKASKFGGILGQVTNADTSGLRNFDTQVDYRLTSLTSGQQVLQSKAAAKFKGLPDPAVENVLTMEAAAVLAAAK